MYKLRLRSIFGHPVIWVNPTNVMLIENYSEDYVKIYFNYSFNWGLRNSVVVLRDELYQQFYLGFGGD